MHDPRERLSPVVGPRVTSLTDDPSLGAETITVVFDLMEPDSAGWNRFANGRDAELEFGHERKTVSPSDYLIHSPPPLLLRRRQRSIRQLPRHATMLFRLHR